MQGEKKVLSNIFDRSGEDEKGQSSDPLHKLIICPSGGGRQV